MLESRSYGATRSQTPILTKSAKYHPSEARGERSLFFFNAPAIGMS